MTTPDVGYVSYYSDTHQLLTQMGLDPALPCHQLGSIVVRQQASALQRLLQRSHMHPHWMPFGCG